MSAEPKKDWIVLGSREHGVSYGPFTEAEAKAFEGGKTGLFALTIENAQRDMYTRVAYGL